MNATAAKACLPLKGTLAEPLGNAGVNVTALPGCNLLYGNTTKPTCNPPVQALDISAFTGTDGAYTIDASLQQASSLPAGKDWTLMGCFADLANAGLWKDNATVYARTDPKMTAQR